jgi:hypothetical protein
MTVEELLVNLSKRSPNGWTSQTIEHMMHSRKAADPYISEVVFGRHGQHE